MIIKKIASAVVFIALTTFIYTSCDVYDGLQPCPRGLNVHFIYDYNMEYADAFHSQVDCITLLAYDEKGNLIKTYEEQGEPLAHSDYSISLDLEHGRYHLIALGGLACNKRSFHFIPDSLKDSNLEQLQIALNQTESKSSSLLHPFFYGSADVVVDGEMYKDTTLSLMKNTNHLRVILQQTDGTKIDDKNFNFYIKDDNSLFNSKNELIPNGGITYYPCSRGTMHPNAAETDIYAAYAEFSTSRFGEDINNRLLINLAKDEEPVIDLPLNRILLMLKSDQYQNMGAQEFLDRQNNWTLVFFLSGEGQWITTHIIVNGWTVRLNDTDL